MLGQNLQAALKSAGIGAVEAAAYIGISEANLYKLFKKDTFEIAYLRKSAELLKLPLSYFLDEAGPAVDSHISDRSQAVNNAAPKSKATKVSAQDLAAQLDSCQREVESLKNQLAMASALIAAKDEILSLLRAGYSRSS